MAARVTTASITLFVHGRRTRKSASELRVNTALCPRARCKEEFGLAAPGVIPQENPCPPDKVAAIKQAFRQFGLL
jgi:hypothetical protein